MYNNNYYNNYLKILDTFYTYNLKLLLFYYDGANIFLLYHRVTQNLRIKSTIFKEILLLIIKPSTKCCNDNYHQHNCNYNVDIANSIIIILSILPSGRSLTPGPWPLVFPSLFFSLGLHGTLPKHPSVYWSCYSPHPLH